MRHLVLATTLLLTACATVTAGEDQVIGVNTTPAGASCTAKNQLGEWSLAKTPGGLTVKRSFSPLTLRCTKGNLMGETTLEAQTRNRAFGNILLGGVPALVDAGTGYGYEYEPAATELSLSKKH